MLKILKSNNVIQSESKELREHCHFVDIDFIKDN